MSSASDVNVVPGTILDFSQLASFTLPGGLVFTAVSNPLVQSSTTATRTQVTVTSSTLLQQILAANPLRIGAVFNFTNNNGQLFFGLTSGANGGYIGDAFVNSNVPYALPYNYKGAIGVSAAAGSVVNITEFTP